MTTTVHLGFEVGTGEPVSVPITHLAVTGQTQMAGKTTTLEALVERSGLSAIAFVTKKHEGSFRGEHHRIAPYFSERADWQTVSAILEATLRERLKFERSWIMRACRGARTLADVQKNVRKLMKDAKGLSADVYMVLDNYLSLVVPQIDRLPYTANVELRSGLNVMDLSDYSTELQSLVIRSVLEWVYEYSRDTLTIIPEAWEFIPQNRGSPVLLACEQLIRKGGAARNFVWLDSQDVASVHKNVLRSVSVWILGVQREANEVKRALSHIPGKRPSVDAVMQLERGQFFVCYGRTVTLCYVQPAWMDLPSARDIATGRSRFKNGAPPPTEKTWPIRPATINPNDPRPAWEQQEEAVTPEEAAALRQENSSLKARVTELEMALADLRRTKLPPPRQAPAPTRPTATVNGVDIDALYELIKMKALSDPGDAQLLAVLRRVPELEVRVERVKVEVDATTPKGRIVGLLAEGFFNEGATNSSTRGALKRTGPDTNNVVIARVLSELQKDGFLTLEGSGVYKAVPGMKVNIVEAG